MTTKPSEMFEAALKAEGVTGQLADVARSIYMQESGGGKNTKTSNAGARGGMQIIPSTFKSVADKDWDINDPMQNARAGIRYLGQLDKKSGGNPALTAAGYYGGPGGMEKARKGIAVSDPRNPNAPTTLQYGQQVVARMGKGVAPTSPTQVAMAPSPQVAEVFADGPAQQASVAMPDGLAPEALPMQVAQVPIQRGPDPWMEFQRQMQGQAPVQVNDLAWGSPLQSMTQVRSPDFGNMASYSQPRAIDFNPFGNFKGRA